MLFFLTHTHAALTGIVGIPWFAQMHMRAHMGMDVYSTSS